MKRIADRQIRMIADLATGKDGLLASASGKRYYPHTLGSLLARDAIGRKVLLGRNLAICMEFIDDIWWMVRNGYMEINQSPYGLVLTNKFIGLYEESNGASYPTVNKDGE